MFAEKEKKSGATESVWGPHPVQENNQDGTTVISNHECFRLFQYNHEYITKPDFAKYAISLSFDPTLNIKILPKNIPQMVCNITKLAENSHL